MGKLLTSWRRKVSLAVHVAYVETVLRGMSAAADRVEVASSSDGIPFPATAFFFTRAMRPCFFSAFPRVASEAPLTTSTCCDFNVAWEFLLFSRDFLARLVDSIGLLHFAVSWIP
jgi:hypothetical protein